MHATHETTSGVQVCIKRRRSSIRRAALRETRGCLLATDGNLWHGPAVLEAYEATRIFAADALGPAT